MKIRMITAFLIMFVASFNVVAGEHYYNSTIMKIYELDNEGYLISSDLEKQFKGSGFIISRVTGEIIGGDVVQVLITRSTKIIITGNDENPFRSIADIRTGVQLIEINEFVPDEEKPFITISIGGAKIVTGLCK